MNPENTFFSVKRFIGRRMSELKDESKQVPYQVRSLRLVPQRQYGSSLMTLPG